MRFTTINSDLFAKSKEANIPDWMKDINTDVSSPTMDLEFDTVASWAEKQTVNRDDRDYTPKQLTAKLNNNEILYAKTELAKFLKNKHYNIKASKVDNDIITLTASLSNIPGQFDFMFNKKDNKVKLANTFNYNNEFYPFNQAGFNECLSGIDIHNPIAQKVEADKASIISTQEIYRRYNGHIRQATDRINELLKEGAIVGVTSDSYGTFLDVDYLFPQQEKEALSSKAPQFEFVSNIEKTKTTEAKSAYQLAMEASKMFHDTYDDFKINNYKRKDNTLYIQASVLDNNTTKDVNLKFDIKNEKVQNRQLPKLANINNVSQSRIHNNNIIKKEHLASLLKEKGYFVNVDDILNTLINNKKIKQVANNQYVTNYSLHQLLDELHLKQNTDKLNKLTDKVKDLRTSKIDIKDTGVREAQELVSQQTLLNAVNEFLVKHFDTYTINDFNIYETTDNITEMNTNISVFNNTNGLEIQINILFEIQYNTIINYRINVYGEETTFEALQEAYDVNQALINYLDDKTAKKVKSNIIFTKQSFKDKLSKVAKLDVDKTLNLLCKQDKIQQLSNDKYASKFTLEQLINLSNVQGLTKKELHNNILNSQNNKLNRLSGIYTQDTLDRDIVDVWSDNEVEIYINNLISKVFKTFNIENIVRSDVYNVSINAVDDDGITKPMVVKFNIYNNHPNEIIEIIKPTSNDVVNEYLIFNKPNLYNAKGIITQKQLENSLLDVIDKDDFNSCLQLLIDNVIIEPLFDGKYRLNNTMSEVVGFLNKNKKTNITANKENRKKAIRQAQTTDSITVLDNDTREVEYIMTDEEVYLYILDILSTYFNYIDIIEIIEEDNSWLVTFTAIDEDGISKEMSALFSTDGNNPGELLEIIKDDTSEIVQEYMKMYQPNTYNLEGVISKNQLQQILNDFVDGINIQDCLDLLVDNDIIEILAGNQIKTKTTLANVIDFLGKKGIISKKKIEAKKQQLQKAIRNEVYTESKPVIETDTREIEYNQQLSTAGIKAQSKLLKQASLMYKNKQLTLKKYKEIKNDLMSATTERQINKINNILEMYK